MVTTGRASSDTRRVLMRQLRISIRDPGLPSRPVIRPASMPLGVLVRPVAAAVPGVAPPESPAAWAGPLPVPPGCCSGSPAAPLSLLKRPCTSVATSGPGVPRDEADRTVSSHGGLPGPPRIARRPWKPFTAARCSYAPPARRLRWRCGGPGNSSTVLDLPTRPVADLLDSVTDCPAARTFRRSRIRRNHRIADLGVKVAQVARVAPGSRPVGVSWRSVPDVRFGYRGRVPAMPELPLTW